LSYLSISPAHLGVASLLIFINGLLSVALKLGLARRFLIASVRMTVQLLIIGQILRYVFGVNNGVITLILMLLMWIAATHAALAHVDYRYKGIWLDGAAAVGGAAWLILAYALICVIQPPSWHEPQYSVPLLGMILGNTLSGVTLSLGSFMEGVRTECDRIESLLALGATRWEAARATIQQSVRTGLTPTLNAMTVAGIVSLPGMMTGQLLSGIDPTQAIRYQIVIFFLVSAGTSLSTVAIVLLAFRRLFSPWHQLLVSSGTLIPRKSVKA